MLGTLKLDKILSNKKVLVDKCRLDYEKVVSTSIEVASKFIKSTTNDPIIKIVAAIPNGKSMKTSSHVASSYHTGDDLLLMPTRFISLCYCYGERGQVTLWEINLSHSSEISICQNNCI